MPRIPNRSIDYTSKDYEAFRAFMIQGLQEKIPEYTDLSQSDAGIAILELNAMGLDILSMHQDAYANEVFLATAQQRESVLKWCKMLDYSPRNASPARFKQVFILSSAQSLDYTIPAGTMVKTSREQDATYFETETDLVIPATKLGNEQVNGEYLYSVTVVQGRPIPSELLGSSNGSVNQSFTLKYSPVIADSISILVNQGSGFEHWSLVENFVDSSPNSKDFTISLNERDQAVITFGDGVFGKIPSVFSNGIFAFYRIGGGVAGNVASNTISYMDTSLAEVASTFNPEAAISLGVDKETVEEIKMNAPVSYRTLWGALTVSDFAEVVRLNFPEVVLAIAEKHATNVDDINIYVMLQGDATLTPEKESEILAIFDENGGGRKIVGASTIDILSPTYTAVNFSITLVVKDWYSRATTEAAITMFLQNYFAKGNYPFGTDLSLTELTSEILTSVEGIKSLTYTLPASPVLEPATNVIYTLGTLAYTTTGGVA